MSKVDRGPEWEGASVFDPSYTGESGGQPRNIASPDINTEDFSAAVDFLGLQPNVDRERIGILGGAAAQLVLEPGYYQFDALDIADSATLVIEDGEVVVHISSSLDHRGQTRLRDADASVVLVFFGTSPAVIRASLEGVVVAPNSTLSLGDVYNSRYRGQFFARSVEVLPGTVIDFAEN